MRGGSHGRLAAARAGARRPGGGQSSARSSPPSPRWTRDGGAVPLGGRSHEAMAGEVVVREVVEPSRRGRCDRRSRRSDVLLGRALTHRSRCGQRAPRAFFADARSAARRTHARATCAAARDFVRKALAHTRLGSLHMRSRLTACSDDAVPSGRRRHVVLRRGGHGRKQVADGAVARGDQAIS